VPYRLKTITEKGLLVSFEGIDASGKNTQSRMLFDALKERGLPCEYLSSPDYSSPVGQEIMNYLLGKNEYGVEARHLLYSTNRYELKPSIDRWISEKKIIILNRYSESNLAYGVADGLPLQWLEQLEGRMPKSDYLFYLKIPPEISAARKASRDRFEANLKFLKHVSDVYDALSSRSNWFTINAAQDVGIIHYEIMKTLSSLIDERNIINEKRTVYDTGLPGEKAATL
jgi:dTMP kinase